MEREYFNFGKDEMLDIFNDCNLSEYIHKPYEPPIDPLHPTPKETLDMLCILRPVNLIVRGLPDLVLRSMQNFECSYTLWNDLENDIQIILSRVSMRFYIRLSLFVKSSPMILTLISTYLSLELSR